MNPEGPDQLIAVNLRAAAMRLVRTVQDLSRARDLETIIEIVRSAARELTGADGASFILRDADRCYYVDEDAIGPLWKGQRFPMSACISGWAMLNRAPAVIEDIFLDARIPVDAYEPTFVKSLVMVPIREADPIGAIGAYWASRRHASPEEVELLQALANTTSVAMENVQVYAELEQRVRDRTSQLEAANRDLDAFSFSVSHDLRTPVRHILGFAGLIQERAAKQLDENGVKYLARIVESGERMSRLIDDLLQFSRLGRLPLALNTIDAGAVVREVREALAVDLAGRDMEWIVDDLPPVRGDRALLRQVFENLLSNAAKYTRGRSPARVEIGASNEAVDGQVTFFVRDNGAGFDMRYADRLFGVFQRLHSEDEFEGTGVGLSTVRRIVARHGGRTWADAKVGEGATFYFTLPPAATS